MRVEWGLIEASSRRVVMFRAGIHKGLSVIEDP
jgi:hypothetical protein